MNREQAEDILEYLLEAAFELDEAKAAANVFADQDKYAAALSALIIKLNSELLQAIYARFRDLIPFEEFPEISSSLRWDQVQLPPSVSEAQVDQIILSVIAPQWHKMARIIWDAVKRSEELALGVQGRSVRGSHSGLGRSRALGKPRRSPQVAPQRSEKEAGATTLTVPLHPLD